MGRKRKGCEYHMKRKVVCSVGQVAVLHDTHGLLGFLRQPRNHRLLFCTRPQALAIRKCFTKKEKIIFSSRAFVPSESGFMINMLTWMQKGKTNC
jgi:hypothetical protein